MKLLYIENHPIFAKTVCQSFLKEHDIDIIPSIKEAAQKIRNEDYDIVLVDYDLDDGKGDEITKLIRSIRPNTKIIAVSSHKEGNDKIFNAGAHAICGKMEFQKINETIDSIS